MPVKPNADLYDFPHDTVEPAEAAAADLATSDSLDDLDLDFDYDDDDNGDNDGDFDLSAGIPISSAAGAAGLDRALSSASAEADPHSGRDAFTALSHDGDLRLAAHTLSAEDLLMDASTAQEFIATLKRDPRLLPCLDPFLVDLLSAETTQDLAYAYRLRALFATVCNAMFEKRLFADCWRSMRAQMPASQAAASYVFDLFRFSYAQGQAALTDGIITVYPQRLLPSPGGLILRLHWQAALEDTLTGLPRIYQSDLNCDLSHLDQGVIGLASLWLPPDEAYVTRQVPRLQPPFSSRVYFGDCTEEMALALAVVEFAVSQGHRLFLAEWQHANRAIQVLRDQGFDQTDELLCLALHHWLSSGQIEAADLAAIGVTDISQIQPSRAALDRDGWNFDGNHFDALPAARRHLAIMSRRADRLRGMVALQADACTGGHVILQRLQYLQDLRDRLSQIDATDLMSELRDESIPDLSHDAQLDRQAVTAPAVPSDIASEAAAETVSGRPGDGSAGDGSTEASLSQETLSKDASLPRDMPRQRASARSGRGEAGPKPSGLTAATRTATGPLRTGRLSAGAPSGSSAASPSASPAPGPTGQMAASPAASQATPASADSSPSVAALAGAATLSGEIPSDELLPASARADAATLQEPLIDQSDWPADLEPEHRALMLAAALRKAGPRPIYDFDALGGLLSAEARAAAAASDEICFEPQNDVTQMRHAIYAKGQQASLRPFYVADETTLQVLRQLAAKVPHLHELIDLISHQAALSWRTGLPFRIPPVLLIGAPGTSKSWLLGRLSRALAIPFRKIEMSGVSLSWIFQGAYPSWRNADMGEVARLLLHGHAGLPPIGNPFFFVDEFDKTEKLRGDEMYRPFYSLLEPDNAKTFTDEFLGMPFMADQISWCMAANSIDPIPEAIRSRLLVIEVPAMQPREKAIVAASIYAELNAAHLGWFDRYLSDAIIAALCEEMPRRMRVKLQKAMGVAAQDNRRTLVLPDLEVAELVETTYGFLS